MLLKSIKNSINAVIFNPSIVLYPVLFLIIVNLLLALTLKASLIMTAFVLFICIFILTAGFLSGWFNVIKNSFFEERQIEKIRERNYVSIFLEGVGKNIAKVSIGIIIYFILYALIILLTSYLALKIFGSVDFVFKDIQLLDKTQEAFMDYIKNLPVEKSYIIYSWQFSFIFAIAIYNMLMMFYYPAVVEENGKNPFINPFFAIKNSIVFVFKHFLGVIAIYIMIYFINLILMLISSIFQNNMIASAILFFLYIYFITTSVVLIFNYYENHSFNRTNSLRKNEICNQICENE